MELTVAFEKGKECVHVESRIIVRIVGSIDETDTLKAIKTVLLERGYHEVE